MAGWSTSSLPIVPALHPLGLQAPMTSSSFLGVTLQLVHPEPLLAHLSPTMFRITGTGRSYHTMHRHDLPIRCLGYMKVPNQHPWIRYLKLSPHSYQEAYPLWKVSGLAGR